MALEQRFDARQVLPGVGRVRRAPRLLGLRRADRILQPLDFQFGQFQPGFGRVQHRLVGARIDHEQHLPFLDVLIVDHRQL